MVPRRYRDITTAEEVKPSDAPPGRRWIAVIGIDRYQQWNRLQNAVSDARGILAAFERLGFSALCAPLIDQNAHGDALRRLVSDEFARLAPDDNLVVFFAGHGHTVTREYTGGTRVKDGYLIPADGALPGDGTGTWLRLESWLADVARSPARHILVLLDACHSGIALGPILRWRNEGLAAARAEPLAQLRARRSRRVITSALDDQRAMDSGPIAGHSLFTGCVIEALTGRLAVAPHDGFVTGSEIGQYVQRRVSNYPGSTQTPDFGALELDDRGELVLAIPASSLSSSPAAEVATGLVTAAAAPRAAPARRWRYLASIGLVIAGSAVVVAVASSRARQHADEASAEIAARVAADRARTVSPSSEAPDAGAVASQQAPRDADPTASTAPGGADLHIDPASRQRREGATPSVAQDKKLASAGSGETTSTQTGRKPARTATTAPVAKPSVFEGSAAPPGNAGAWLRAKCGKADFAAVYDAPAPAPAAVHAALRALKRCRDSGHLSNDEFDRYQTALVAKL